MNIPVFWGFFWLLHPRYIAFCKGHDETKGSKIRDLKREEVVFSSIPCRPKVSKVTLITLLSICCWDFSWIWGNMKTKKYLIIKEEKMRLKWILSNYVVVTSVLSLQKSLHQNVTQIHDRQWQTQQCIIEDVSQKNLNTFNLIHMHRVFLGKDGSLWCYGDISVTSFSEWKEIHYFPVSWSSNDSHVTPSLK